jgi:hypothetical protein
VIRCSYRDDETTDDDTSCEESEDTDVPSPRRARSESGIDADEDTHVDPQPNRPPPRGASGNAPTETAGPSAGNGNDTAQQPLAPPEQANPNIHRIPHRAGRRYSDPPSYRTVMRNTPVMRVPRPRSRSRYPPARGDRRDSYPEARGGRRIVESGRIRDRPREHVDPDLLFTIPIPLPSRQVLAGLVVGVVLGMSRMLMRGGVPPPA